MDYEFKKQNDFNKRLAESTNIKQKYVDRIPIIVEKYKNTTLPNIDKCKYLVPRDMNLGQFIYIIRKELNWNLIKHCLSIDGVLGSSSTIISELYDAIIKMKMDFYMSFTQVKIHLVNYL